MVLSEAQLIKKRKGNSQIIRILKNTGMIIPTIIMTILVITAILAPLKLTFYVSLLLCIPYILHHLWAFIAPGLYQHEKKIA